MNSEKVNAEAGRNSIPKRNAKQPVNQHQMVSH